MTDSPTWVQEMLAHLKTNIRFYKKTQFVNLPPAQLAPARFYLASKTCLVHSFSFLQKTCFCRPRSLNHLKKKNLFLRFSNTFLFRLEKNTFLSSVIVSRPSFALSSSSFRSIPWRPRIAHYPRPRPRQTARKYSSAARGHNILDV